MQHTPPNPDDASLGPMDDSELHAMLAHDEHHWWYRGRRRVLRAAINRCNLPPRPQLLDAGCGSGRTLDELAQLGTAAGVDLSPEAVAFTRRRGHEDVRVAAIESLPFDDATFDLVTCLDVIEHTPDDVASLAELRRVTRPGGVAIVTVPAHPVLWSHHDVVNRHYRRYRVRDLRAAAAAAGWDITFDTYFNSALLAPAAAVRLLQRTRSGAGDQRSDLERTPAWLDRALELPLAAEARLVRARTRIPFGLSLLAVLRDPLLPVGPALPVTSPAISLRLQGAA